MDLRDNNPQKKWKNREFTASFEFALTGIITAFKEERNMRKHLVSAILVVLAGLIFRVSATEWLFLLMAVFLVIALEIVNSAIENGGKRRYRYLYAGTRNEDSDGRRQLSCGSELTRQGISLP